MASPIQHLLTPEEKDLGDFQVRRSLPQEHCRMVGPFIFFDHVGPAVFPPGQGIDVRPHPHINLATVTYLFEGALLHRDSLGSVQEILPGAVNWMTAGRGIVHSERSPAHTRQREARFHGIQTWIGLPTEQEETDPWFGHHPADSLPSWETTGATVKLIAGETCGRTSPVQTFSPMIYLDVTFSPGGRFEIPSDCSERAVYSITEGLRLEGTSLPLYRMAVLTPGQPVSLTATETARCIVIGGDPIGPRLKWWNFVSSRPERIEQAKQDWKAGRFAPVPEEDEFIPLPEEG
jgi:redox-sensitive bicupin YhaK (pirin superfamily)